MIVFNIEQTLLYNVGINTFSLLIALIIYLSYRRNFAETYDVLLLRRVQLTVIVTLISDIGNWSLNGISGDSMRVLNYVTTMLHFSMQIVVVIGWWRYASYRIFGQTFPQKTEIIFVRIPLIIIILVILTTPYTHLYFYIDQANIYHRGILSLPMFIINLLYPLSVSIIALFKGIRERYKERKIELMTIALFVVLPLIGGVIQTATYGLSLVWPCAVISSLMILLNKEGQAILQDPLTGLNNRRNIDRLFKAYDENQNRSAAIMMLDLNDFKRINDQFGHSQGDQVLINAAKILRATFTGTSAFLARYGGDEFVVVLPKGNEALAKETARLIREKFASFHKTCNLPCPLSVSIGYAVADQHEGMSLLDLLKLADENMYLNKVAHRSGEPENQE